MTTFPINLNYDFYEKIHKYREDTNRSKLKDNSMKQYINNFNLISKMVNAKEDDETHFIMDFDRVIKSMKEPNWKTKKPPSNATTRNYLNSIIIISEIWGLDKTLINKYIGERDKKNQIYNEAQATAKLTDSDVYVTKEEVDTMLKTIDTQLKGSEVYQRASATGWDVLSNDEKDVYTFMIMMYVYLKHPVRNDFGNMTKMSRKKHSMLKDDEKEGKNYLLKDDKKFMFAFGDYKTNKNNEIQYVDIVDKELLKHLRKYIKNSGWDNGRPLFTLKNEPFTKNAITKFLQKWNMKYLEKPLSTRGIRKSFYSEKYGGDKEVNLSELKEDAKNNLHSVGTAVNIYTNTPKKEEKNEDLNKAINYIKSDAFGGGGIISHAVN